MWMMSLHLHQKSDYDYNMNEVNKLRVGQFRDMLTYNKNCVSSVTAKNKAKLKVSH